MKTLWIWPSRMHTRYLDGLRAVVAAVPPAMKTRWICSKIFVPTFPVQLPAFRPAQFFSIGPVGPVRSDGPGPVGLIGLGQVGRARSGRSGWPPPRRRRRRRGADFDASRRCGSTPPRASANPAAPAPRGRHWPPKRSQPHQLHQQRGGL
jgi:hypothetical protein